MNATGEARRGVPGRTPHRPATANQLPVAFDWFTRHDVGDGTTWLTEPAVHPLLRCNIWHVSGRDRDLVVDTGLGVASLIDAASDLFGGPILAVATHAHMDHVGGFHEFADRAIHHDEVAAVTKGEGALPLDVRRYDAATLDALTSWGCDIRGGLLTAVPAEGFDTGAHELSAIAPTVVVADGDVIDLGERAFEVLHVPGHSPGSIALWDATSGVLFSGDAIYDDGPLLDELAGSDIDAYVTTMGRLRELPVTVAHGGHGPSMDRRRFREIVDEYLARRDHR